jgi:hypothetical protein
MESSIKEQLKEAKTIFLYKLVPSLPMYVTEINIHNITINRNKYHFMEFSGYDGIKKTEDYPISKISKYYLLNNDTLIWRQKEFFDTNFFITL